MTRRRRGVWRALGPLALACALLAAGCTERPPRLTDGGGTLVFVTGKDISHGRQWDAAIKEWNASRDPDVRMVELSSATDLAHSQMAAVAQEDGGRFDVLNLDVINTAEFAYGEDLLELPRDWFGDLGDFIDATLDTASWNGKLWALPFHTDAGLLYYRSDLLRQRGWKPPASWAELQRQATALAEAGLRVTSSDGSTQLLGGYGSQLARYEGLTVNVLEAIWEAGGRVTDERGTEVEVSKDLAARGLGNLAEGVRAGWIPRSSLGYTEQPSLAAFQSGQLAFMRNWPYVYRHLSGEGSAVAGKFGVAPLPWPSALGGSNLAISRHSTRQRAALEFIKFLTSRENQVRFLVEGSLAPTRESAYTGSYDRDPRDDQPPQPVDRLVPFAPQLRQSVRRARLRPVTPYYTQVSEVIQREAFPVLDRGASASGAAGAIEEALPDAFDGRHPRARR